MCIYKKPMSIIPLSTLTITLIALAGGNVQAREHSDREKSLPLVQVLTFKLADAAAEEALEACENDGYRVSVAVVDQAGLVKSHIRGDGAGPHTLESARKKAYTSASLRRPTSALVDTVVSNPAAEGLRDMNENILILGGGLPIFVDDQLVGGIGVGGAPRGDLDEACAQTGVELIQDAVDD